MCQVSPNVSAAACERLPTATSVPVCECFTPFAKTPAIRPVPRMPQESVILMLVSPCSGSLLSSCYSQPTFYAGYIVYTASLLVTSSKGVLSQKHRCIEIDEGESAQTSSEMCSSGNSQT